MRWYRLAADQGDTDAQYNLALMYYNGEGVLQDYAEALRWSRLAADQGDTDAQRFLALMYYDGKGVPQDDAEAVRWWRPLADQGVGKFTNQRLRLGMMPYLSVFKLTLNTPQLGAIWHQNM